MKLKNIRFIGRYKTPEGKKINIYKGFKIGYGVDVIYYLYRGQRIFVSDLEFSKYRAVIDIKCNKY